jgi:predicted transcriptional regulator
MSVAKRSEKRKETRPSLSDLELEVMDVVWELGECTSAQVIEAFARKRPLAPTTIRTVLANLRRKGYLKPVPTVERGFRLRALVSRDSVARWTLRQLLSPLFQGSPRQAIACLLEDSEVTDQEIREIQQMLRKRKREGD